jgi:UDP-N-acetylglucosamine--dolichyl-phosphate N-acetylglucosaminephosphotransferase
MTENILIVPVLASFFVTLFLVPYWIRKAKQIGLVWEDMNKVSDERVAGSGGIAAIVGFVIGVLLYIAYIVFFLESYNSRLIESLALLNVVLLVAGLGFIDDLLGWRHGGLSKRSRIIFLAFAAIPLMAINAGRSLIAIPFFGEIELGLVYPLFFIPIGIAGATFTFNMLAGFNGLEAGQGIILLSSLGLVAYLTGSPWLSVIALCMVASLIAFLFFNFYPAKVFPGDSLTYAIGGLIAIMAILGNFERVAVFFFIPHIIEMGLKIKGKLVKQSFGMPLEDGSLGLRYDKIYGLEHLAIFVLKRMGVKPTETKVVFSIWLFQIVIIIIGLFVFRESLFR